MNFSIKQRAILLLALIVLPIVTIPGNIALAQNSLREGIDQVRTDIADPDTSIRKLEQGEGITTILKDIILWLLTLVAVLALAVLIWGGIMYIISLGDEERTRNAKRIILYAILGLLIVGVSFLIIQIIAGLLTPTP